MSRLWLPPLLNEIADVAGVSAALSLAEARGGSRVSFPRAPGPKHWLVQTVGQEAATAICEHFRVGQGGSVVDLPVGPASSANATRRKVDQMILNGLSADKIASTVHVHRTTVFRRKKNLGKDPKPADDRQPDLFTDI